MPNDPNFDAHDILSRTGSGDGLAPASPLPLEPPRVEGYRPTALLGRGGMGVVWRAVQLSTRREVALKLVTLEAISSEKVRRRFDREVELAAGLEHPNIARVYDSGRHGNLLYYAMELIEGVHLDEYVRLRNLDRRAILSLMRQVCDAIRYAHRRGVIHRDLKPSNILVSADGKPHVVDFGLAKTPPGAEIDDLAGIVGELAGTPAFMSPEQATGDIRQIDTQSDVYSLGVILYRLLTGEFPHPMTGSRLETLRRIATEPPRRPSEVAPKIDADLEALLMKALAFRPDSRYASAAELERDIDAYLRGDPLSAREATIYYLARKRLARNRAAVIIATAMVLIVFAAALVSHVEIGRNRQVTREAREEAERQAQFAHQRSEELRRSLYAQSVALADAELRGGELDRVSAILESCPADLRHWEWFYLKRRHEEGLMARAVGSAEFVAFLQKMVAFTRPSASRLTATTALSEILFERPNAAQVVALSPDCRHALTATADAALLRAVDGGAEAISIPLDDGAAPRVVEFLPGAGSFAVALDGGAVELWRVESALARRALGRLEAGVSVLAVSRSGEYLLAGGHDGRVSAWRISRAEAHYSAAAVHTGPVTAAAFSPDGRWSATGGADGQVVVRDAMGAPWLKAPAHRTAVAAVGFAPGNGPMATGGADGSIRFWEVPSGQLAGTLPGHTGAVRQIAFSPDGRRMFTCGDDATVRVWDTAARVPLLTLKHRFGAPTALRLCGQGRRLAAIDGGGVTLWDGGPGTEALLPGAMRSAGAVDAVGGGAGLEHFNVAH